jgi:hypothetical protein
MFPPIAEGEKEERYTDSEIVKTHQEEVIVNKGKTQYDESMSSALYGVEEIIDCEWEEDHIETQKDFLGDERWEDKHQRCQRKVRKPVGKRVPVNLVIVAKLIFRVVVFC